MFGEYVTVPKRSQPKPNGSDASEKMYWPVMMNAVK